MLDEWCLSMSSAVWLHQWKMMTPQQSCEWLLHHDCSRSKSRSTCLARFRGARLPKHPSLARDGRWVATSRPLPTRHRRNVFEEESRPGHLFNFACNPQVQPHRHTTLVMAGQHVLYSSVPFETTAPQRNTRVRRELI
jgi:hypothetical protein